jgi:hypothetical protein
VIRLFEFCQAMFCIGAIACAYFIYSHGWDTAFDGVRGWTLAATIASCVIAIGLKDLGRGPRQ